MFAFRLPSLRARARGTSSAAPLVAGVAALVISTNPGLTGTEVKMILQESADKIIDPNPDPVLGLNKGSYDAGGHSEWFGFGRVNAALAVRRAHELRAQTTGISDLKIAAETGGTLPRTGAVELFKVTIGAKLSVTLDGPQGQDFDIYLREGSVPTTEDYDILGYSASADEKVVIDPTQPGVYYIMVRSYRGSGDFKLNLELE